MDTLKRAALISLGVIVFGFMIFSFATIGLAVLALLQPWLLLAYWLDRFYPKEPERRV